MSDGCGSSRDSRGAEAERSGLLRDLKPGITTVGALLNPDSMTAASQRKDIEGAARTIGLKVEFLEARNNAELEAAFKSIDEGHIAVREVLLRKARQAETGSHMSAWLSSPALQRPT